MPHKLNLAHLHQLEKANSGAGTVRSVRETVGRLVGLGSNVELGQCVLSGSGQGVGACGSI